MGRTTIIRNRRARTALLVPLAGLALVVSGCGLLGQEDPPQEPPAVEQPEGDEQEPSDAGGEEPAEDDAQEPSDAGGATDDQAGGATDTELAAPGTEVPVGEAATIHVQVLEEGEEYYGYGVVSTTVTEIVEGDPAIIEQFDEDDQADLEGMTPWYVKAEHEILSFEGDPNADMTPSLEVQDAEGNRLTVGISFGGNLDDDCDLQLFDQAEPGATASTCDVVFTDGEPPARVAWEGDDKADGDDNPYEDAPVVWVNEG
ncbi:hypothetical protein M4D54_07090 [Brachybacterium sp. p3-SID1565]|uniref:hypothetical protein n=1 Tax=unclassified Brachybacterium TaxID=2623841 RepID=UPI0021AAB7AA|nr:MULTISPECIES: hypothetical protein [unclassified Brachybacterium]MCT1385391.1 hypothetical protein [Brachybacterium sp. p3-SID1565]MCT1776163.1 hypothetical protein [Brachybacterium sp. p3-SID957]